MTIHDPSKTPIAVVGVSAVFPGSVDETGFWNDIIKGRDLIQDIPASHWLVDDYYDEDMKAPDKTYAKRGAFIQDVPFDPLEWGVPPSILQATDTTQLLALICAKRVLADALDNFEEADKSRTSVILGVTGAQELLGTMVNRLQRPIWTKALRELGYAEAEVGDICDQISSNYVPWQESTFPGLLGNVVAGRIANRLDLGGTNCVTDAACASSFSAISMAVNELWLGQSDMVISGGCDTMNDIFMYMCFSKTPALSPTGECAPFADTADGTLLGEGMGMVALKRLADAERDGNPIYAVLNGIGSSSDGRSKSVYAPVSKGQSKSLVRAYEQAGYGADTVELVEAHGTGTKAGDAAEFGGLRLAFEASGRTDKQWCSLGTVKSQIGHTKAAAGAAGMFKVVMALHHKVLPPTIKIDRPNPKLDIENSPFHLNTVARPWIRGSDHPRRGSVSSFGFGGSNFHLALAEYTGPGKNARRFRTHASELVLLGADSPAALAKAARDLAAQSTEPGYLAFAAYHTQTSFNPKSAVRLAVVVNDEADLRSKLSQAADRIDKAPASFSIPTGMHYSNDKADPGKVGFVFPGQGSQYVRMGDQVAMHYDAARLAWDEAADLDFGGSSLHAVVHPVPVFDAASETALDDQLRATEWAQPAIGVVSLSHLGLLRAIGVKADAVAGHSYGEISALHAAGAISRTDMLRIARKRGELMAEAAVRDGAMIAVPADLDTVRPFVEAVPGVVMANHNHHKQVVVSGPTTDIDAVEKALLKAGIEPKRLQVATAFHSPVVADSVEPFRSFLKGIDFKPTGLPCYRNAEAVPYGTDPKAYADQVAEAVAQPVRFVEQIENMHAAGIRTFIEVGPSHVLTNLVGEILGDKPHTAINLDRRKKDGCTVLANAFGRMAVAGMALDFAALWELYGAPVDPHTLPKAKLAMMINGANYEKPYPPKDPSTLPKANPVRVGSAASHNPAPQIVEKVVEKVVEVERIVEVAVNGPASSPSYGAPAMSQSQGPIDDSWVAAFQEVQRATVDAHSAYQQAMADSHVAFLRTVEASLNSLSGVMHGGVPAIAATMQTAAQAPAYQAPAYQAPAYQAPAAPAPVYAAPAPVAAAPAPVPAPAPRAAAPVTAAPSVDMHALLMSVVADKTGYPSEMLSSEMNLEADLGIDSIKRVEILSAMRERAPSLPEVDAGAMASLQTLGQIVDYMQAQLPASGSAPAAAPVTAAAGPAVDMHALLMSVVADKTGYPSEMLSAEMNLEADLGIDSIKRVEILSAMRERAPSLPEVDAGAMASLQTLGQIVDYMQAQLPAGSSAPAPATAPAAAASAGPAVDMHGLLMAVVADKTGYPADMLNAGMNLEADLGIDSIKRVEILSAMRERAPGLPEVDAGAMSQLQTLGQIVDYMQAQMPAGSAAPASSTKVPAAAAPAVDLHALLMAVVADKTGYPADMLNAGMNLEADLGIDSIKRVEILSAMRERAPGLPEVDAGAMSQLQTLGQIVDYMQAQMPASTASAPVAAAKASAPAVAIDLHGLLMSVVADKTGYPADMLAPHMNLEADLGIDSIKRVEILSAMREQAPSLPEVDAGAMSQLQTLGQIISYMEAQSGGAAAPTPATSAPAVKAAPALGRWVLKAVPTPAHGLTQPGLKPGAWVVVTGDDVFAPALAKAMTARGCKATHVATVSDMPTAADVVIHTGGLVADVTKADAVAIDAFRAARTMAPKFAEGAGLFVTVQDTGGRFLTGELTDATAARAWFGGLPGLVKTAAQEWKASTKAIDIEVGGRKPDVIAAAITAELFAGGPESEVGLSADSTRLALQSVRTDAAPTKPSTDGDSVIVATGGARGVTAATLIALAKARGGKFALLGRTALSDEPAAAKGVEGDAKLKGALLNAAKASGTMPSPAELGKQVSRILAGREVRATLAAIEATGAKARYVPVDVNDAKAVNAAFDSIRKDWGAITALVHGAGVLADRFIADKTDDQFAFVYDTKVGGLRTLLAATSNDPLTAIVTFSSVAGRCGNQGQCDYAMANEVLNKVAAAESHKRGGKAVVKSLGWGPWEGGMVTPQLKARFDALGVPLIPLDVGAQMLVDDLADRSGDVEVVLGGEPKMGPLAQGHSDRSISLRVHVSQATHGYLADHTIAGTPVVPMVLAIEWCARAAKACRPDLFLIGLTDVAVMRGIKLAGFAGDGDWFDVTAKEVSNGTGAVLSVQITDLQGRPHYTAMAQLGEAAAKAPGGPGVLKGLSPMTLPIYDGHVLFHGATFQVLKTLEGISDAGMVASKVTTTSSAGWSDEAWSTDPAAWDGGLQMALLFSQRVLGGASIPMKLASVRTFTDGPPKGPVKATLTGSATGKNKAVTNIVFTDASGAVVASLEGVETILRP